MRKHGAEFIGTCPFHDGKTPPLVVPPKPNAWHCLGACNMGGSTIDSDDREALKQVAAFHHQTLRESPDRGLAEASRNHGHQRHV